MTCDVYDYDNTRGVMGSVDWMASHTLFKEVKSKRLKSIVNITA